MGIMALKTTTKRAKTAKLSSSAKATKKKSAKKSGSAAVKLKLPFTTDPSFKIGQSEQDLLNACEFNDFDRFYNAVWKKANIHCRKPVFGSTPLAISCRNGNAKITSTLIQLGANAVAPDEFGATPLHWAAHSGNNALIKNLVQEGGLTPADLRRQDAYGSTALHFASVHNLSASVMTLVESGADVCVVNKNGDRPSALTTDEILKEYLEAAEIRQAQAALELVKKGSGKRSRNGSGKKQRSASAGRTKSSSSSKGKTKSKNFISATSKKTSAIALTRPRTSAASGSSLPLLVKSSTDTHSKVSASKVIGVPVTDLVDGISALSLVQNSPSKISTSGLMNSDTISGKGSVHRNREGKLSSTSSLHSNSKPKMLHLYPQF